MLDTAKLEQENVVLYTPAMSKSYRSKRLDGYVHEFLAFGVIPGSAYRAVRFRDLEACGFVRLWRSWNVPGREPGVQLRRSLRMAIESIRSVSLLFGEDLAAVVGSYILTLRADGASAEAGEIIMQFLTAFGVREDLRGDTAATLKMISSHYEDAVRAINLVQKLVVHVHGVAMEDSGAGWTGDEAGIDGGRIEEVDTVPEEIVQQSGIDENDGGLDELPPNTAALGGVSNQSSGRRGRSAGQDVEQPRISEKKRVERAMRLMREVKTNMRGWEWV